MESPKLVYGLYTTDQSLSCEFVSGHVWGRNHFGIYNNVEGCSYTSTISEGAAIANVVMNTRTTWIGGAVYGTRSQAGQANEVGFQIGDANWKSGASTYSIIGIWMTGFADPGHAFSFPKDWGVSNIQVQINSRPTNLFSTPPAANSEIVMLAYPNSFIQRVGK
jgi:hypothetical protein